MDIIDTLQNLSVSRRRSLRDDDFLVDRLHHRYTVAMLVIFCAVISTSQYAGDPINCWVPAQFTGSFETYTNRLCWLQNTYYVDEDHDIPDDMAERDKTELKYYQWIHLIILLQSILFLFPRVLWRSLNDKCGIELVNYVDEAYKFETVDEFAERDKLMNFLSGHLSTFIHAKDSALETKGKISYKIKRVFSYFLFWTGKRFGNYLIILYIFCKLFYLINVFGQLFLMTKLLGIQNYHYLGFEILQRMATGHDMIANHYFPKVSHCDFKVRELGNDHQYTVQCVLTINIFVEKIYIIIWFWFVILTCVTFFDLLSFVFRNCFSFNRHSYVEKHILVFSKINSKNQKKILRDFVSKYLRPDVILVFRILSNNVNAMVVSELVKTMWDSFSNNYKLEKINVQKHSKDYKSEEDETENISDDDIDPDDTPKFPTSGRSSNDSAFRQEIKSRTGRKNNSASAPMQPTSSV